MRPKSPGSHFSQHLSEDQLLETYLRASDGGHLDVCDACRERYDAMAWALEHLREDGVAEADAVFPPERLHEQRDRILRRLERHGHPAEVLLFPMRSGVDQTARRLFGPARRWIAGAAAAGLVAGLFLGFAVDRRVGSAADARRMAVPASPAVAALQPASGQASLLKDEQILTEIEDALTGPTRPVLELRAIDAMTMPPELQEASFVPR